VLYRRPEAILRVPEIHVHVGLTIVALAYFRRQVPETKSRSLQDIERDLALPAAR
jgi:hypothetical protein